MAKEIVRAMDLAEGDMFETLLTGAAGVRRKTRINAADPLGVPVELWYLDGKDVAKTLHPAVRVRLQERAKVAA